jgi:hypothetical protein
MAIGVAELSRWFIVVLPLVLVSPSGPTGQLICPGKYGGHLQGITVDDDGNLYWSFTTDLVKTDAKGKLLKAVRVPSHHGDLTWRSGKVYVAVNLGKFNKEPGHAKSWVYVYGAKKLELAAKHRVPEVVHGAGGIGYRAGHFFVVGGLPADYKENYVYEYDKDLKFLKRHVLKSGHTRLGIQTACYAHGRWWFGCYGKPAVVLETDKSFKRLKKHVFNGSLGIVGQPGKTFLIGRSHGKKSRQGRAVRAKLTRKKSLVLLKDKAQSGKDG